MLKALLVYKFDFEQKEIPVVPSVGDRIDLFCQPPPTVTSVLWFPSKQRLAGISKIVPECDVIIFAE